MHITIKQTYDFMKKALKQHTYQAEFPESMECPACKQSAIPMMVIDDNEGLVSEMRPEGVQCWPHDCLAIALYLCPYCGEMVANWNQG